MANEEIRFDSEYWNNKMGYYNFMAERIEIPSVEPISNQGNESLAIEMLVNMYQDMWSIMQAYGQAFRKDIDALISAGQAWIDADEDTAKNYE